jgi:hypothetical protein
MTKMDECVILDFWLIDTYSSFAYFSGNSTKLFFSLSSSSYARQTKLECLSLSFFLLVGKTKHAQIEG